IGPSCPGTARRWIRGGRGAACSSKGAFGRSPEPSNLTCRTGGDLVTSYPFRPPSGREPVPDPLATGWTRRSEPGGQLAPEMLPRAGHLRLHRPHRSAHGSRHLGMAHPVVALEVCFTAAGREVEDGLVIGFGELHRFQFP